MWIKQTVKVIVILSAKTRMFLEMENAVTECCQILSELINNTIFGECYMDTGAGVGVRLGCGCPIR